MFHLGAASQRKGVLQSSSVFCEGDFGEVTPALARRTTEGDLGEVTAASARGSERYHGGVAAALGKDELQREFGKVGGLGMSDKLREDGNYVWGFLFNRQGHFPTQQCMLEGPLRKFSRGLL